MPRFRKRPVVIEAVQFTGDNWFEVERWVHAGLPPEANAIARRDPYLDRHLIIRTLEGEMRAGAGDWIIRGVKGEHYPCKPDIFEKTYEPAD